jgi:phage repressor protein C with HTH and peptisase S24 domain
MNKDEEKKLSDLAQRFLNVMDYIGISGYKLKQDGIINNEATLTKIKKGIQQPSRKTIDFFCEKYNVNKAWLYTGEGLFAKSEDDKPITEKDINDAIENANLQSSIAPIETRPRIPYDAAAGTLTDTVNGVTEYECEQVPVISVFPKYDFTIRITGKSMEPEYFAGDEVACLKIDEARFIQWGRVHVLDTTQGVVIKRIYEDGDKIRCNSYNTEFPDFSISKDDIRSFNLVVGSIRL